MISKFLRLLGIDNRSPEEKITDGIRKQVAEHRNTFKTRRSHSVFPRYDEATKKWYFIIRNY